MVYFFCGHRGCGKNYLANQIAKKAKIKIIDTGPIIREMYDKYNSDEETFKNWIIHNENKYGKDFTNKLICKSSQIENKDDYIIIGYRSMQGIQYFNDYFKITNFKIIFIDGDYELFRHNYNERENSNLTIEEYEGIIRVEEAMGINQIREFALNNNQAAEYYFKTNNDNFIFKRIMSNNKFNFEEIER